MSTVLKRLGLISSAEPTASSEPEGPVVRAEDGRTKTTTVRLTDSQVDEMVASYQAGATVAHLVEEFGIHRTTVVGYLERRGVARRVNSRRLTDENVEQAARYYASGESLATVAGRFNVEANTIRREFKKAGVPIRPRRGYPSTH